MVARELARRYGDKIVSTSLNPGNISSDLQRHMPKWQLLMIVGLSLVFLLFLANLGTQRWMLYPVSYGALTQLYCATAPGAADANGGFFIPWARLGKSNKAAENLDVGEKLWRWLEEETKKY